MNSGAIPYLPGAILSLALLTFVTQRLVVSFAELLNTILVLFPTRLGSVLYGLDLTLNYFANLID